MPWTSQTGEVRRAHIERSDVAILPRAAVVGEAMLALALADALLADLGGDTMGDLRAAVRRAPGPCRRARAASGDGRDGGRRAPAGAAARRAGRGSHAGGRPRTPDGRRR